MKKYKFQKVLNFVNRVRKTQLKLGPIKRLPRGRRDGICSCPIALGISMGSGHRVYVYGFVSSHNPSNFIRGWQVEMPEFAVGFMNDFDNGDYPELIKKR